MRSLSLLLALALALGAPRPAKADVAPWEFEMLHPPFGCSMVSRSPGKALLVVATAAERPDGFNLLLMPLAPNTAAISRSVVYQLIWAGGGHELRLSAQRWAIDGVRGSIDLRTDPNRVLARLNRVRSTITVMDPSSGAVVLSIALAPVSEPVVMMMGACVTGAVTPPPGTRLRSQEEGIIWPR